MGVSDAAARVGSTVADSAESPTVQAPVAPSWRASATRTATEVRFDGNDHEVFAAFGGKGSKVEEKPRRRRVTTTFPLA